MNFPISITIDRTEHGGFRATSSHLDSEIAPEALAEILEAVRRALTKDEDEFEQDLDYTLSKNAELYRRLAL